MAELEEAAASHGVTGEAAEAAAAAKADVAPPRAAPPRAVVASAERACYCHPPSMSVSRGCAAVRGRLEVAVDELVRRSHSLALALAETLTLTLTLTPTFTLTPTLTPTLTLTPPRRGYCPLPS